jgi:hypothetical protein
VKKYLADKTKLPAEGDFNATGRGFPDVAALGHNYFMSVLECVRFPASIPWSCDGCDAPHSEAGGPNLVDGTSCSAPVWGGVMGLLNSFLKSSGKPVCSEVTLSWCCFYSLSCCLVWPMFYPAAVGLCEPDTVPDLRCKRQRVH